MDFDARTMRVDIMYIEDDEVDAMQAQRSFEKINKLIKFVSVTDALLALDMLYGRHGEKKMKPDVILLDLNLPKMHGIDFLKTLRGDNQFIDVKVFILTCAFSSEDKIAMQTLNVRGNIIKPLEYKDALNVFWSLQDN